MGGGTQAKRIDFCWPLACSACALSSTKRRSACGRTRLLSWSAFRFGKQVEETVALFLGEGGGPCLLSNYLFAPEHPEGLNTPALVRTELPPLHGILRKNKRSVSVKYRVSKWKTLEPHFFSSAFHVGSSTYSCKVGH